MSRLLFIWQLQTAETRVGCLISAQVYLIQNIGSRLLLVSMSFILQSIVIFSLVTVFDPGKLLYTNGQGEAFPSIFQPRFPTGGGGRIPYEI